MQTRDQDGRRRCTVTKAELYFEYLADEGFRPKIDDEGDVSFKKEGSQYLIYSNENDPQLFRLCALFIWPIESYEERVQALEAASKATRQLKSTKVYVQDDNVHATIELLFSRPEDFKPLFHRALGLVDAGVERFVEGMQQHQDNGGEEKPPLALA